MSEDKVQSTTLKWALPVRVDKLVAHFEAYVETLPTITALRLCNRFGSGPQCYLSKLPIELVDAIEECIVEAAREETLHRVAQCYRNWKSYSDYVDEHFHHESQHALFHWRRSRPQMQQSLAGRCMYRHDTDEDTAEDLSVHDLYGPYEPDDNYVSGYAENDEEWASQLSVLNQHRALLQSQFGLDAWTAHVRFFPPSTGHQGPSGNQNHTVVYLTLPNDEPWQEDMASHYHQTHAINEGSRDTMPVSLGGETTQALRRRFTRALKLLGLAVHVAHVVRWSTVNFRLDYDEEEIDEYNARISAMGLSGGEPSVADAGDGSAACWPQLIVLSRCLIREFVEES